MSALEGRGGVGVAGCVDRGGGDGGGVGVAGRVDPGGGVFPRWGAVAGWLLSSMRRRFCTRCCWSDFWARFPLGSMARS